MVRSALAHCDASSARPDDAGGPGAPGYSGPGGVAVEAKNQAIRPVNAPGARPTLVIIACSVVSGQGPEAYPLRCVRLREIFAIQHRFTPRRRLSSGRRVRGRRSNPPRAPTRRGLVSRLRSAESSCGVPPFLRHCRAASSPRRSRVTVHIPGHRIFQVIGVDELRRCAAVAERGGQPDQIAQVGWVAAMRPTFEFADPVVRRETSFLFRGNAVGEENFLPTPPVLKRMLPVSACKPCGRRPARSRREAGDTKLTDQ